jgi:flagellar P-ring protein precursor FlgI
MRTLTFRRKNLDLRSLLAASAAAVFLLLAASVRAERVKDLASVQGVRLNQLMGYGLVVGLDGTGDQTSQAPFTIQSIKNMLIRYGVTIPANTNPQLKNVAAVTVNADLPPFSKPGQQIDITVSSIGNAKSLRGGTLIMTPLRGVDGEVYAIAQGNLVVSGFGISGQDGSRIVVNVPSAGRVPNGATVEREVPSGFAKEPFVMLNLHVPDFTTSARLTEGINKLLGEGTAQSMDGVSVKVTAPADPSQRTAYLATLEAIEIEPAAVAHGSLSVTITERSLVSQPNEFAQGQTIVVPQSGLTVNQPTARMFVFDAGVDLNDIVRAVNQVGAAPGDLVAILEALKESGALRAELIVI